MVFDQKHRYMGGLDGLRGLSVLAVIAYHMNLPWAKGGFLGVGIFFVLSGYLITDLLIQEWEETKTIDLKKFWIRRAKRLLPAMLCLLIVVMGYVLFFHQSLLRTTRMDATAALVYFSNWWSIFHQQSYFDSFANPSLLKHFWSLAVEEQFYLIWPLFVIIGLRFGKSIKVLYLLTMLFAASSILFMGFLYQPDTDPSRVYYGTDTRAFALLFGAILAYIWPSKHLSNAGSKIIHIFLDSVGLFSLILLLLAVYFVNQYEDFLYTGGLALFSLVTVMLISVLAHPSTFLGKWMGVKPLRWIGVRSYGMYLWHYPIILLTTPASEANEVHPLRIVLQLAIIFTVSTLSLRYIENPIRRSVKKQQKNYGVYVIKKAGIGLSVLFLIFSATSVIAQQPNKNPIASEKVKSNGNANKETTGSKSTKKNTQKTESTASLLNGSAVSEHSKTSTQNKLPAHKAEPTKKKPIKATNDQNSEAISSRLSKQKITAIGDSVMLGAEPYLKKSITHLDIDCKIGRQFREAFSKVAQLEQEERLGRYVLVELGTNGPFTTEQVNTLIELIGSKRKVILVNTRVPRPWESIVNQVIKKAADTHDNVIFIDWHSASEQHSNYFSNDGVHLTVTGAKKYTELIVKTIESMN